MIRFFITLFISALFVFSVAQESNAGYHEVASREFELKGRISDTVSIPPFCGHIAFAVAVRMEIISYSDTSYKQDHIVIIYTCPREMGESYFNVGQVHSVKVQDHNPASFGWAIINNGMLKENMLPYDLYVIDKTE